MTNSADVENVWTGSIYMYTHNLTFKNNYSGSSHKQNKFWRRVVFAKGQMLWREPLHTELRTIQQIYIQILCRPNWTFFYKDMHALRSLIFNSSWSKFVKCLFQIRFTDILVSNPDIYTCTSDLLNWMIRNLIYVSMWKEIVIAIIIFKKVSKVRSKCNSFHDTANMSWCTKFNRKYSLQTAAFMFDAQWDMNTEGN